MTIKLQQANKYGMANRDNVRARIRGISPKVLTIMNLVDMKLNDLGGFDSSSVTLTEDMAQEEQTMALIEKYLKEGDSLAAATHKSESVLIFLESF